MRRLSYLAALALAGLLSTQTAVADTSFDNGGGDNKWETGLNWQFDVVPPAGDQVRIGSGFSSPQSAIVDSATETALGTINIGTLFISDSSTTVGTLTMSAGTIVLTNEVRVGGNGNAGGNGTLLLSGGQITASSFQAGVNNTTGTPTASGTVIMSGGTISVSATGTALSIGNRGFGYMSQSGGVVNSVGSLSIGRAGSSSTYNLSGTGRIALARLHYGSSGTSTVPSGVQGGTFNMSGGELSTQFIEPGIGTPVFTYTGGTLTTNNWTVPITLTNGGGTLSPGNGGALGGGSSFGTTTFVAGTSYVQQATGHLHVDLGPNTATDKDFVSISGSGAATLAGFIDVDITGAVQGTFYDVLVAAGGLTDTSTLIVQSGNAAISKTVVGGTTLRLTVDAVPEPTMIGLAALGGLSLLRRRPRRRNAA